MSASPECTCSMASAASRMKRTPPALCSIFPGDIFLREAEDAVKQNAVQLDNVKLGLARGDPGSAAFHGLGLQQVIAVASDNEKCGTLRGGERREIG